MLLRRRAGTSVKRPSLPGSPTVSLLSPGHRCSGASRPLAYYLDFVEVQASWPPHMPLQQPNLRPRRLAGFGVAFAPPSARQASFFASMASCLHPAGFCLAFLEITPGSKRKAACLLARTACQRDCFQVPCLVLRCDDEWCLVLPLA